MTRAMDPEVSDALWAAIEPILPTPTDDHPLGCHNPRVPDRVCFRGILIRLVTGASWVDIEAMMDFVVSDTTLRARRDHWIAAGVFDQLETEAHAGYDRILDLDLDVVAVDGSLHKAPCGGEGTGRSPVDRGKLGWKWSVASERGGIPIAWAIDGANRHDVALLEPTLDAHHRDGAAPRHRHHDPRPRLRLRRSPRPPARPRPVRPRHPTPRHQTPTRRSAPPHARAPLDRRGDQHVVVELRTATPQHRPQTAPPPRRLATRHRRTHRRTTPRLPQPLEPPLNTYPRKSLDVGWTGLWRWRIGATPQRRPRKAPLSADWSDRAGELVKPAATRSGRLGRRLRVRSGRAAGSGRARGIGSPPTRSMCTDSRPSGSAPETTPHARCDRTSGATGRRRTRGRR